MFSVTVYLTFTYCTQIAACADNCDTCTTNGASKCDENGCVNDHTFKASDQTCHGNHSYQSCHMQDSLNKYPPDVFFFLIALL